MSRIKGFCIRMLNNYASFIKSDSLFLRIKFRLLTGRRLNLHNPKSFGEKLQWLKIYDRKPEYTTMVDKYQAKDYVAGIIGKRYIIPTLGVWDDVDDIDFSLLPNQFVLKTTHAAGMNGVVICKNKSSFDYVAAKNKLRNSLKGDTFWITREWPYKNIRPRIIAERYLEDETGYLIDYKVMCFNGEAKLIQLHMGRANGIHTQDFYDVDWNKLVELNQLRCVKSDMVYPRPICLSEMLQLSCALSKGLPQLRVDWYVVKDQLFFGELTFFDASGFDLFLPNEKEDEIGGWIKLPALCR